MKQLIIFLFLGFFSNSIFGCSCDPEPDEYYDFIALVTICNNEPEAHPNEYNAHVDFYKSEFEIIELYKGANLTHVFAAGYFNEVSEAACGVQFDPAEEWIIYAEYNPIFNNFITSYCSGNKRLKTVEGLRNWGYRSSDDVRNKYRQKYLGIAPWKFSGDTLIQRYSNGKIEFIKPYEAGKLHGTVKRFYPSGKIYRIENYKNGKLHGEQKWYNEEGFVLSVSNYKSGRRDGLWESYFADGMPYTRKIYNHGTVEFSEDFFWKTNRLKRRGTYDFSTCTKESKRWSENGILEYHSISYHNGNFETWDFDFRGNLKSYSSWNAKKKERVSAKF